MPALEENASAFPLSEPLRLPNPRAHEQSPDHRHQHEVFTTHTSQSLVICSLDLLNPFSVFLENTLQRQTAYRLCSLRPGWRPTAAQNGCKYVLGRQRSPSRCQIPRRDHRASLWIRDDASTSFLCPPASLQTSSTGRLLRYPKGCNPRGQRALLCCSTRDPREDFGV